VNAVKRLGLGIGRMTMSLVIELTPEQEQRLREFACRQGLEPTQLAQNLVTDQLPDLPSLEEVDRRGIALTELIEETQRLGLYE
jgi:hypothetical protein